MMKQLKKCLLSLKSLKLLSFSLLISFGILFIGSSVNAGYSQLIGVEGYPSLYDSNYSLTFIKGGGFLSNFLGQGKSVLALKSDVLVWRAPNGYLYAYLKPSNSRLGLLQGFFDRYYSCDYIPDYTGSAPGNCSIAGYIAFSGDYVESNREVLKSFFSKVKQGDLVYYNYSDTHYVGSTSNGESNAIAVCWSSEEIGKSLCFFGGRCSGVHSYNCVQNGDLINSQGIRDNMTFAGLPVSYIGSAPGQFGYANEVPTTGGVGSPVVNEQTTFNALYNQGYRSQMCYGGFGLDDLVLTGDYSFSGIQLNSGATIFELYDVYGSGQSFVEWYDNNYIDYLYLSSFNSAEDLAYFLGKSKGLVGLGITRETLFKGEDKDFRAFGLRTFCQYYFSGVGLSTDIAPGLTNEQVQETLFNDIVSDIGVLVPIPGSPLDQLFEVGANSGSINPGCLEGDVSSCLANSGLNDSLDLMWRSWSVSGIKEGVDGILPKYIVFGFLGILLLYYLRR